MNNNIKIFSIFSEMVYDIESHKFDLNCVWAGDVEVQKMSEKETKVLQKQQPKDERNECAFYKV